MMQPTTLLPTVPGLGSEPRTRWRVTTAARVFALATALGLTVLTGGTAATVAPLIGLTALAAAMCVPMPNTAMDALRPAAEGAVAIVVIASAGSSATPLLVYLLIPPFAASLNSGVMGLALVVVVETVVGLIPFLAGLDSVGDSVQRAAAWMLAGVGLGLFGSWVRKSSESMRSEQGRYESAHRLVAALHALARDLPHGLDAPSLAQRTLSFAVPADREARSRLLLRDTGAIFRELASQGAQAADALPVSEDPQVLRCWELRAVQAARLGSDAGELLHRTAFPLRVAQRMIGVVVIDTPEPLSKRDVHTVQTRLDEQSLRLDTAALFEQVRSMATVEERHRLAREIHDGIAQELASLGYLVDDLEADLSGPGCQDTVRQLRGEVSRIVSELRLSIFDLRMDVTQYGGLGQALSDYARDVAGRAGMTVHMALAESWQRLPVDVETELLRIGQEAITNARKHACANNLWVTLNTNGGVALLRVEDDGIGSAQGKRDHFGLQMMRERADRIGAELAVTNRPLGGTSVVVALQPSNCTGAQDADVSVAR